jgi:hypothetical protein
MCLWRAPEKYITGAMAPVGAALDRAGLRYKPAADTSHAYVSEGHAQFTVVRFQLRR